MPATLLLFTNDAALRASVEKAAASIVGCNLKVLTRLGDAVALRDGNWPDVLLLHLTTPADETLAQDLIRQNRREGRGTAIVPICDRYETPQALQLLSLGAAEYLARPLEQRRLTFVIDMLSFKVRHSAPPSEGASDSPLCCIGDDRPFHFHPTEEMAQIVEQLRLVASLPTTILLTGETGTGKSLLARLCHEISPRSSEPFVAINCGALSPSLIESEMFGHVKGAFTGADVDRAGKFAVAEDGTLLLDDIDALPLSVQANLLRAIDERLFEPVGSDCVQPLKARIIVATNGSLEDELSAGRFRSDLYYRINVVTFNLPPLRARKPAIEPLVRTFVADIAAQRNCPVPPVSPRALAALQTYDWPGNIRELRNVLERAISLFPGKQIEVENLPAAVQQMENRFPGNGANGAASKLHEARFDAEFRTLRDALGRSGNNRSRAARHLGISRVTLYKKLHKYDLI